MQPQIAASRGLRRFGPPGASGSAAAPRASIRKYIPALHVLLAPVVITLGLWWGSSGLNTVSVTQAGVAFALLLATWWSYWNWHHHGHQGMPVFAGMAAMYWLYFGVQVFWGGRRAQDWRHLGRLVSEASVTNTMLLVLVGVGALWVGMRSTLGRRLAPKRFPDLAWRSWTVYYLQAIVLFSTVLARNEALGTGGDGIRQIIMIIETTPYLTALIILYRRVLEGTASLYEKGFLLALVGARLVLGISSGWVGSAITLVMVGVITYLHKRRKLPMIVMLVVIPYILFFQVGKETFRTTFWRGEVQANPIEKITFWVDASVKTWQMAMNDPSGVGVASLLSYTLSRVSLLSQVANVIEQTPSVVPYQYGKLYSYLPITFIPRFLWPDKPSMSEANRFYQVAYGLTHERDLDRTSIAVGTLAEGYINFGWLGTMMVMFVIGILLDFWDRTFLYENRTSLALGIGIALLPQLLVVESQLAQYVSGIIQHIVLTLLIYLPVLAYHGKKSRQRRIPVMHAR